MTRKTPLEREIEEVGRRSLHRPDALHNLLLLECLEDMQAERVERRARKRKKPPAPKGQRS